VKFLYLCTKDGGIVHGSDQGNDVKNFHKDLPRWKSISLFDNSHIQADDKKLYYTGNLAFAFYELLSDTPMKRLRSAKISLIKFLTILMMLQNGLYNDLKR